MRRPSLITHTGNLYEDWTVQSNKPRHLTMSKWETALVHSLDNKLLIFMTRIIRRRKQPWF